MGETVRPWGTAPPIQKKEGYKMDNVEAAIDGMWEDEGPDDPNDMVPLGFPESKEAVVTLVLVETGTSRQMKPYADLTVRDNTTGERFRVRTVKLYEEMRDLKPGSVMRIKWFENGPFKNLVSGTVLSSAPKAANAPVKEVTQAVYISAKEPKDALDVLMTEWFNRARFLWMNADGTTMDVKEMTREQLQDAIAECERLCKEKEPCSG